MADINLKRLLRDLANPDDDLRALSAMTLMKVEVMEAAQREELFEALMKATCDKNIAVRFFSRRAIDKLRRDKDIDDGGAPAPKSIEGGLVSEDFEDRLQAVMRIGRENKAEFKDRLISMLQSERHDFVKASLISCLKLFLNKNEASILSPFIKDPDGRVRSNTIEALEAVKADGAIPLLFPCLEDSDNRIRAVAAKALQSFGEGKVFAVLKKMLSSNDEWMKFSAIHALSHINAGASIQLLVDAAKPPTQPDTRLRAIVALANFHDLTSFGFLKHLAAGNEEQFKLAANKSLKLIEEKFGAAPPMTTLVAQPKTVEKTVAGEKTKGTAMATDLTGTVVQLFRRGKEEAVTLSQDAAIKFALTDLEKEATELAKEAGRVLFDLYQRGDLQYPSLLSIGHEILRMNFFIQKYTDEESKPPESGGGFFSQIKKLFSKAPAKSAKHSQLERFTQNREDLFFRLGRLAFQKMEQKEFESSDLEGYFQTYVNLQAKISREKDKMNSPA